jgi:hypothetical protein
VERYLSEDPLQWSGLASTIQWRRLQLLLLREILLELRELNDRAKQGLSVLKPCDVLANVEE